MRPPKLLLIAALFAALALLAAGCGGGDDGGETTTAPATTTEAAPDLTKAELISQGDAICAEVNAAVGTVAASTAEIDTQISQTANLYTGMVESLEDLGEPLEPQGYAEFIEAAREFGAIEDEIALAAEREDTEALGDAATRAAPALEELQSQAEIYGFEECSEGPTATTEAPAGAAGTGEEVEEGGVEVTPEVEEEVVPEEVAPEEEEIAPETGGAGGEVEEVAPEGGGTGAGGGTEGGTGSESGGVGPG